MSRWLWVALSIVVVAFAGTAYAQFHWAERLPEKVPIHWNANFEPDGFVNRDQTFMIFYLMPTIMAGTFGLLMVLPWVSPQQFKVDDFRRIYDYVVALVVGLFAYMHVVLLTGQITGQMHSRWFMGGIFLFFGLLGNVLGKVRKNFWMGVRTPWTLASDVVWEKTHRLAAWLFVVAGFGGFAAVMLGAPPLWCLLVIIPAALTPVVYSLVIYKQLERSGRLEQIS